MQEAGSCSRSWSKPSPRAQSGFQPCPALRKSSNTTLSLKLLWRRSTVSTTKAIISVDFRISSKTSSNFFLVSCVELSAISKTFQYSSCFFPTYSVSRLVCAGIDCPSSACSRVETRDKMMDFINLFTVIQNYFITAIGGGHATDNGPKEKRNNHQNLPFLARIISAGSDNNGCRPNSKRGNHYRRNHIANNSLNYRHNGRSVALGRTSSKALPFSSREAQGCQIARHFCPIESSKHVQQGQQKNRIAVFAKMRSVAKRRDWSFRQNSPRVFEIQKKRAGREAGVRANLFKKISFGFEIFFGSDN